MTYTVREELKPSGLVGISDEQINDHWNLYAGYVTQSNALKDQLISLRSEGKGGSPEYADRRRRFGFEFNGMVLHEYYFSNLAFGISLEKGLFTELVEKNFGTIDVWKEDFINTGKSRSVGWAICYFDPVTGDINNHFIQLHEDGNIAGYVPLVVMDVFEHAYMVDHNAGGRPAYIDAYMKNINWSIIEERTKMAVEGKIKPRF